MKSTTNQLQPYSALIKIAGKPARKEHEMTTPNEELRKQLQQIYKSGELYYGVISDTTDRLQSQAERIATLEDDVEYLQEDINAMCNAIHGYRWSGGAAELIAECFAERDELRAQLAGMTANTATDKHLVDLANDTATRLLKERDTLRAQLVDAELHTKQVARGLDKATAQLAAIRAQEPVLVVEKEPDYWSGGHFHEGSKPHIKPTKVWCLPIGTQLFTRPMPAQDVTELVDCLSELCDIVEGVVEDKSSVGSLIDSFTTQPARTTLSKYKGAK